MNDFLTQNREELEKLAAKKRHELMQFRFLVGQGQTKDNKHGRKIKKEIAQILTALNKKP